MPQTEAAASTYNLSVQCLKFPGEPMILTETLSQK